MDKTDLFILYKLYLFALMERKEYGDKYGDTDELIEMYEEKLEKGNILVRKKKENKKMFSDQRE